MRFLNLLFAVIYGTAATRELRAAIFDEDTVLGFLAGFPQVALSALICVLFLVTTRVLGAANVLHLNRLKTFNYALVATMFFIGIIGPIVLLHISSIDFGAGLLGLANAIKLGKASNTAETNAKLKALGKT